MPATPGRNKLERGTTFTWHAKNLSADLVPGSLNGMGFKAGKIDMTGASAGHLYSAADRKEMTITAKFIANNTATTGSSTVLNADLGTLQALIVDVSSGGAALDSGDIELTGNFVLLDVTLNNEGGKYVHNCVFEPADATIPAWGTKA